MRIVVHPRPMRTLLVTVGSTKFDDLIEAVQFASENGSLESFIKNFKIDNLIIQHGKSKAPKLAIPAEILDYIKPERMSQLLATSTVIISHGGAGTIFETLRSKSDNLEAFVIVENCNLMDSHQSELIEALIEMKCPLQRAGIDFKTNLFNDIHSSKGEVEISKFSLPQPDYTQLTSLLKLPWSINGSMEAIKKAMLLTLKDFQEAANDLSCSFSEQILNISRTLRNDRSLSIRSLNWIDTFSSLCNPILKFQQIVEKAHEFADSKDLIQSSKLIRGLGMTFIPIIQNKNEAEMIMNRWNLSSYSSTDLENLIVHLEALKTSLRNFNDLDESKFIMGHFFYKFSSSKIIDEPDIEDALNSYISTGRALSIGKGIEDKLISIIEEINSLVSAGYNENMMFRNSRVVYAYAAVICPSFSGKTQLAFTMSFEQPVFYFNFANITERSQTVYLGFANISEFIIHQLELDLRNLKSTCPVGFDYSDSSYLKISSEKLLTIGFIWRLVQFSTEFDFNDKSSSWILRYLSLDDFYFEKMTIEEYYRNMSKLTKSRAIKIPIIFIDEFNFGHGEKIRLLRNLSRCIGLPCVLSSTNAQILNKLNLEASSGFGSSGREESESCWVKAISKLPQVHLEIIAKNFPVIDGKSLEEFIIVGQDGGILLKHLELLNALGIYQTDGDVIENSRLLRLWSLIVKQSKTALQGVVIRVIIALLEGLRLQRGCNLEVSKIWGNICSKLGFMFRERKPEAFSDDGSYFSLRMFYPDVTFAQPIEITEIELKNLESKVYNSINHHFYYFGDSSDPGIFPFGHDGKHLKLKGEVYRVRSFFKPFYEDCFSKFEIWSQVHSYYSIARILADHQYLLQSPLMMIFWAVADATHKSYEGLTKGPEFVKNLIKNVQMEIVQITEFPATLESFLRRFTIPFLIPGRNGEFVQDSLNGLCEIGQCYRCANKESVDVKFEVSLGSNGQRSFGFAECKYIEKSQGKDNVMDYYNSARNNNSPITFFVTYSLNDSLKNGDAWAVRRSEYNLRSFTQSDSNSATTSTSTSTATSTSTSTESENQTEESLRKKTKLFKDFKISVFSCFYKEYQHNFMEMVALREEINPDGVFIILETNFDCYKQKMIEL